MYNPAETLKVLGWKLLNVAPNESNDWEGRNVSGPYLTKLHTYSGKEIFRNYNRHSEVHYLLLGYRPKAI